MTDEEIRASICELVAENPKTPLSIVEELEARNIKNVRHNLLRMICEEILLFPTDGKLRLNVKKEKI